MNGSTRSGLLALAGGYIIYLAWEMFQAMRNGTTSIAPALNIVFIVFFVLAGSAVLFYAYRVWRKSKKEDAEETPPPRPENDNSLK